MNAAGGVQKWRERIRKVLLAARIAIVLGFCLFLIVSNSPDYGDFFDPEFLLGRIRVVSDCAGEAAMERVLRVRYTGWPSKGPCIAQDDTWGRGGPRDDPCMYDIEGAEEVGLPRCVVEAGQIEHVDEPSCFGDPYRRSEEFCWRHEGSVGDSEVKCSGEHIDEGVALTCKVAGENGRTCSATIERVPFRWPGGLSGVYCGWAVGAKIYCFGGSAGAASIPTGSIVEFDPVSWTASLKPVVWPGGWTASSCASGGNGRIYCFGGEGGSGHTGEVLEYDPAQDTLTRRSEKLPGPHSNAFCVGGAGERIVCFGGNVAGKPSTDIIEYFLDEHRFETSPAKLPDDWTTNDCVSAPNGRTYCVGAVSTMTESGYRRYDGSVLDYDPATRVLLKRDVEWPTQRDSSCFASADSQVFCFGIQGFARFDPATGKVSRIDVPYLLDQFDPSCVASEDAVYCFGDGTSRREGGRQEEGVIEIPWSILSSAKAR